MYRGICYALLRFGRFFNKLLQHTIDFMDKLEGDMWEKVNKVFVGPTLDKAYKTMNGIADKLIHATFSSNTFADKIEKFVTDQLKNLAAYVPIEQLLEFKTKVKTLKNEFEAGANAIIGGSKSMGKDGGARTVLPLVMDLAKRLLEQPGLKAADNEVRSLADALRSVQEAAPAITQRAGALQDIQKLITSNSEQVISTLKYEGSVKEQIENQGLDLLLHDRLTTLTMSKLLANTLGAIPLGAFLPKQLCKITLLQHGLKESKFLNMSSLMTESLKRISLHSIRDVVNPLPVKSLRLTALKTLKWSHLTAAAEKKLSPKRRLAAKRDKNGKLIPTKCCFQTGFGYKCFIKCNAPHKDVTVQQCEANKKCQSDCKSCLPLSDTTTTAPKSTTTAPPSTTTTAPTSTTTAPRVTTTAPKPRKTLTDAMLSKLVLGDFNLDLLGFTAADIDLAFLARLAFSKLSNDVLAKIKLCDILNAVLNSVQVKDIAQSLQEYLSGLTLDSVKPDFLKNIKISSLVDNARSTLKLQDFLPWKLEQLGLGDQAQEAIVALTKNGADEVATAPVDPAELYISLLSQVQPFLEQTYQHVFEAIRSSTFAATTMEHANGGLDLAVEWCKYSKPVEKFYTEFSRLHNVIYSNTVLHESQYYMSFFTGNVIFDYLGQFDDQVTDGCTTVTGITEKYDKVSKSIEDISNVVQAAWSYGDNIVKRLLQMPSDQKLSLEQVISGVNFLKLNDLAEEKLKDLKLASLHGRVVVTLKFNDLSGAGKASVSLISIKPNVLASRTLKSILSIAGIKKMKLNDMMERVKRDLKISDLNTATLQTLNMFALKASILKTLELKGLTERLLTGVRLSDVLKDKLCKMTLHSLKASVLAGLTIPELELHKSQLSLAELDTSKLGKYATLKAALNHDALNRLRGNDLNLTPELLTRLGVKRADVEQLKSVTLARLTAPKTRRLAEVRDKDGKLVPTKCCKQVGFPYMCLNKCRTGHVEVSKSDCAAIPTCRKGLKSCEKCLPATTTTAATTTTTTAFKPFWKSTALSFADLKAAALASLKVTDINLDALAVFKLNFFPADSLRSVKLCDLSAPALAKVNLFQLLSPALGLVKAADLTKSALEKLHLANVGNSLVSKLNFLDLRVDVSATLAMDTLKDEKSTTLRFTELGKEALAYLKLDNIIPNVLSGLKLSELMVDDALGNLPLGAIVRNVLETLSISMLKGSVLKSLRTTALREEAQQTVDKIFSEGDNQIKKVTVTLLAIFALSGHV